MLSRRWLTASGAAAILGLVLAASSHALTDPARTTYLTFSGAVALPGVTLGAGSYIFELAEPGSRTDIVRVRSRDRSKVYYMGFTRLVERPRGLPANRFVSLSESPSGVAPRILAWYPTGEATGRQFVYAGGQ
jgi:hypothetical protein